MPCGHNQAAIKHNYYFYDLFITDHLLKTRNPDCHSELMNLFVAINFFKCSNL